MKTTISNIAATGFKCGAFRSLAKTIIKSIAENGYGTLSDTCTDIVSKCFNDQCIEDIQSMLIAHFCENATEELVTIASSIKSKKAFFVFADSEDGKKLFLSFFSVVRSFFESNKGIKVVATIDDFEKCLNNGEDSEIISRSDFSKYVKAITEIIPQERFFGIITDEIDNFVSWIYKNHKKASSDFRRVAYLLSTGMRISSENDNDVTIASVMGITKTKAYYLVKTLRKYHEEYKPIERKTISFAKVESNDKVVIKRVDVGTAKLNVCGKMYNTEVCTTPIFTSIENRWNQDTKTVEHIHVENGGEIVEKKEGTRVKKYVVNMDKNASRKMEYGNTYCTDNVSNKFGTTGNNGHSYGIITGDVTKETRQPQMSGETITTKLVNNRTGKTVERVDFISGKALYSEKKEQETRSINIERVPISIEYRKRKERKCTSFGDFPLLFADTLTVDFFKTGHVHVTI